MARECTDIEFPDSADSDLLVVVFNSQNEFAEENLKESCIDEVQCWGWERSGVHKDPTGEHQFKIDYINNEEKKSLEYLAGWQRERADALNARRDYEQKLESLKEIVKEELLADFLPIMDSINLAVQSVPEDVAKTSWFAGIAGIGKQVDAFLGKMDMQRISAVGKPFNPHEHEAMEMVDNADPQKSQTVAEEVQPGYALKGKVIRPSLVKVFK